MQPMQPLPDTPCDLNGTLLPLSQARVSVLDRGFIFGDGVYEVVPVYGRRLFRFNEHMARLARSLERVRIANPHGLADWLERCRRVVAAQDFDDQLLYLQVTRGVAPRNHPMPPDLVPTVFLMSSPFVPSTAEQRHRGVACVTARDFRWELGDIKNISLLANVLARQIAVDRGAAEVVMLREQGNGSGSRFLTEGSSSNVWVVHEGALLGPPKGELILEGIRVELLRELCEEEGIAYNLRPIPEADVLSADELILSSAGRELLPVTLLDGQPVGHGAGRGKPGPVFARLHEAYQRAKRLQSI